MKRFFLLTAALAALVLIVTSVTSDVSKPGKTIYELVSEIKRSPISFQNNLDDRTPKPMVVIGGRIQTGSGVSTTFTGQVLETSAPVIRYAWDFDGDKKLDWEGRTLSPVKHTYSEPGNYVATLYAIDNEGRVGLATVEVIVESSVSSARRLTTSSALDFKGMKDRQDHKNASAAMTARKFALLVASDGFGNSYWIDADSAYSCLKDHYGYEDSMIVFVSNVPDSDQTEDTLRIDYPYTPTGMDSAFNYLLSRMTSADDLHVFSSGHGTGYFDSSCIVYGDDAYLPFIFQSDPDNLTAGNSDPDETRLESEFKLTYNYDKGVAHAPRGMNTWTAYWANYSNGSYVYDRWKLVATFSNIPSYTAKTSDTDIYVETLHQYLKGDINKNGKIDVGEVGDYDGDSIPPIDTSGGEYVFDEDDWNDTILIGLDLDHDNESGYWKLVYIDSGFDGHIDVALPTDTASFQHPVVRGSDADNDGIIDGVDINRDGDQSDSCGVNEEGFAGLNDNDIAAFLDSLDYNTATFVLLNCFSGGFINDLSRPGVIIATATVEGTVSWGTSFTFAGMRGAFGFDSSYSSPVADPDSNGCVSFLEAFNYVENNTHRYRERLDDNGDGVGHVFPLSSGGDGALAKTLSWGDMCELDCGEECIGGNVNGDCVLNVVDLNYMVSYFYYGGAAPNPINAADVNANCVLNVVDLNVMVAYFYGSGVDTLYCGCVE